eukprot:scaffold114_cov361-Pinguiococcus_pyrenoidosus.AAC.17
MRLKACVSAATTLVGVSELPSQRDGDAAKYLLRRWSAREEARTNLRRTRRMLATSAAVAEQKVRTSDAKRRWTQNKAERSCNALRVFWRLLEVPVKLLGFGLCVAAASALHSAEDADDNRQMLERFCWQTAIQIAQSAGPTFVKLLQWCTTRRDLFSVEFCDEIGALQYRCQRGSEQVRLDAEEQMEQTFGRDWKEFVQLGEAIGAGCIATVYRGRLGPKGIQMANDAKYARQPLNAQDDDVEVAIKVLRKGARESVLLDLDILDRIVACLEVSAYRCNVACIS